MSAASQPLESMPMQTVEGVYTDCEVQTAISPLRLVLLDSMLPARIHMECIWTDKDLIRFGAQNPHIRFEQEPNGDLTIMSPTGSHGKEQESDVALDLGIWARQDGRGRTYNSNGGFRLPDGSMRAADAAWVSWDKIRNVSPEQTRGYYPLCPEFVVEIRSGSDSLTKLREKMEQWLTNGCELAWLIDPSRRAVEIYRPGQQPEVQEGHSAVYGEGPVVGFVLELGRIWA